MGVYNGACYVRNAIDSILTQTFGDFEFVIVNDGSTDSTSQIIRSYDDPRIVVLNNDENIGLAASLNRGISASQGTYIARQDADDFSHPERLGRQVQYLDLHPQTGVVGTSARWTDDAGTLIQVWPSGMGNDELQRRLLETCYLIHGSTMYRRLCFDQVGGYDTTMRTGQDYDLWLRIAETWDMACLPEVLYVFRRHEDAVSMSRAEEQAHNVEAGRARAIRRRVSYASFALGLRRERCPSHFCAMGRRRIAQRYAWWSAGARGLTRKVALQFLFIALLFDPTAPNIWSYVGGILARKMGLGNKEDQ